MIVPHVVYIIVFTISESSQRQCAHSRDDMQPAPTAKRVQKGPRSCRARGTLESGRTGYRSSSPTLPGRGSDGAAPARPGAARPAGGFIDIQHSLVTLNNTLALQCRPNTVH